MVCGACEEPDRFIRIQALAAVGRSDVRDRFTHPLSLSPDEWASILASLRVQTGTSVFLFLTKKEPDQPVFRPEEVADLSQSLSKAFAQAQPDELVVFGLTDRADGLMRMTTGGWFARGGQLHFILANYRFTVSMESIRERLSRDPLRPNTGLTFELLAGPHQTLVSDRRLVRLTVEPDPVELALAYQPLLASSEARSPSTGPSAAAPPVSLEERLDRLKHLHDRGLISESEYRDKKKQLLEGL